MKYLVFAALVVVSSLARAQQNNALSQFFNQTSLYPTWNISLSPDGSHLAYIVSVPGGDKTRRELELRIRNVKNDKSERICCGKESAIEASWSPDGQFLAFVRTASAEGPSRGRLNIYSLATKKTTEYPQLELATDDTRLYPRWQSMDNVLVFRNCSAAQNVSRESLSAIKVYDSFIDTSSPSPNDSATRPDDYRPHPTHCLDTFDLKTGHVRSLFSGLQVEWPSLSPDGRHLAYLEYKDSAVKTLVSRYQVHLMDLTTGFDHIPANDIVLWAANDAIFSWTADSAMVAFRSLDQMSTTGSVSYHLVQVSNFGSDLILDKVPITGSIHGRSALWSRDNRYFAGTVNGRLYTWSTQSGHIIHAVEVPGANVTQVADTLDARGQLVAVASDDADSSGVVISYDIPEGKISMSRHIGLQPKYQWGEAKLASDGHTVFFAAWSLNHFAEIQALSLNDGKLTPVTDGDNRPESMYARYVHIRWRSANGAGLEGGLLLPPQSGSDSSNKQLPLIVQVYPSPNNRIGQNDFGLYGDLDAHSKNLTLVAAGYALFVPNCPVGANSFVSDLANDVFPGIQKVLDLGTVDPTRIGLLGQSDGVVAALTLLTISAQFKAAVLMDGYGDFAAEFGEISGYGAQSVSGGRFVGEPWKTPLSYLTMSPIFRLDHFNVPILLFHGTSDNAVPVFAGEEIFTGLRALRRRAQLVEYTGGGHTLLDWSPEQQNDAMTRILDWYNTYLAESRTEPPSSHGQPLP
jgi:dipeptidyl aminopeptidase/acylaminoacyl peptidase